VIGCERLSPACAQAGLRSLTNPTLSLCGACYCLFDNLSISLLVELLTSETKAKPSGLPDSNVIFFVATKKTKQKKTWRCAGHVLLDSFWWQILLE
jgi:hypothetical protein